MSFQQKLRPILVEISEGSDIAMVKADSAAFDADCIISELSGVLAIINTDSLSDDEADEVHDALVAYRNWRDR